MCATVNIMLSDSDLHLCDGRLRDRKRSSMFWGDGRYMYVSVYVSLKCCLLLLTSSRQCPQTPPVSTGKSGRSQKTSRQLPRCVSTLTDYMHMYILLGLLTRAKQTHLIIWMWDFSMHIFCHVTRTAALHIHRNVYMILNTRDNTPEILNCSLHSRKKCFAFVLVRLFCRALTCMNFYRFLVLLSTHHYSQRHLYLGAKQVMIIPALNSPSLCSSPRCKAFTCAFLSFSH